VKFNDWDSLSNEELNQKIKDVLAQEIIFNDNGIIYKENSNIIVEQNRLEQKQFSIELYKWLRNNVNT
jgi:hypothetical protein